MEKKDIVRGMNCLVIANAVELATSIIERVGGDDISTVVDGKPVTPTEVSAAIAAKLRSLFIKNQGVN